MEWLLTNYPKATTLDDYGMYGRDFPPEVVEYVHACWDRTGDVYRKPSGGKTIEGKTIEGKPSGGRTIEGKPLTPKITDLKILTPEEAEAVSKPEVTHDPNTEALKVLTEKGPKRAAEFMMEKAGGDYARMRSMYG